MVNINIGYNPLGQENNTRQLDQQDKYNGGQYKTICYKWTTSKHKQEQFCEQYVNMCK